ncbi:radical SAM protein [Pseudoalteromonas spongiae]|uniref:radical SAM protein n=1 Tax=Pseudoalteromonas spongiae TaxID=298657 RepID=UPI00110A16EB|nr:radical SAM protein [Pseudoalteromonas spongiae]TMO84324.1 hypothetical protein CWC15_12020 [Pseudoalteromonas spongiae]
MDRRKVFPRELVIHLTETCPLECSHCCVESNSSKTKALKNNEVLKIIGEAKSTNVFEKVCFVGGEPFLEYRTLTDSISFASKMNMSTSVTTSAYWAKTPSISYSKLSKLTEAGLQELCISFDDYHMEYVSLQYIINACYESIKLGLKVILSIVVEPNCLIDREYIERLLNKHPLLKKEVNLDITGVTTTGRAEAQNTENTLNDRAASKFNYSGPCMSALRQFSVYPNKEIVPCCGALPFNQMMSKGNINNSKLSDVIMDSFSDKLMKWIAFEGPMKLLAEIEISEFVDNENIQLDGICSGCNLIYTNQGVFNKLIEYLESRNDELKVIEAILDSVNMYQSPVLLSGKTNDI